MKLRYHQVDAFTDELFHGNPAGVCPLGEWLPAETMQKMAMENNQAETAFYVRGPERFYIRWFTPAVEVDLCGHATLAAAFVIFHIDGFAGSRIELDSRSGVLMVRRDGDLLTLDFPADCPSPVVPPHDLIDALGAAPREAHKGKTDYMLVYGSQRDIEGMAPDFGLLAKTPTRGVIVTAPGDTVDFVSRFFRPPGRDRRGPGHGLGPHDSHALLGGTPEKNRDERPAVVQAGRDASLPAGRVPRRNLGPSPRLSSGYDRIIKGSGPNI